MSAFRVVGIVCDGLDQSCGEEVLLHGGATFPDVWREARKIGWIANAKTHLCPEHQTHSEDRI